MLTNEDIITITSIGDKDISSSLRMVTSHTLSPQGAYTVSRFKTEVERILDEYNVKNKSILKEVGITDAAAFDKRVAELKGKEKLTKEEKKEYDESRDKLIRLSGLRKVLIKEEVNINCKPMSYDDWFKFKNENKTVVAPVYGTGNEKIAEIELFELIEQCAENVLWKAPED